MFNRITKKDIDLLAAYNRKTEPSRYASILRMLILPLCLILMFGSIFAYQQFRILSIDNEIQTVDKDIAEYQKKIKKVGSKAYDLYTFMANQNEKISSLINNINSYPKMNSELMMVFINNLVNGLSNSSITFQNGVISVSASATDVLTIENYVRTLRASNLFTTVEYNGYQSSESSKTITSSDQDVKDVKVSTQVYAFQVTCIVKGVGQ